MARKLKRSGPPPYDARYYGPAYSPRAETRNPIKVYADGSPRPRGTGVYKPGKAKTVLRDPYAAAYDRRNKRPTRS